MGGLSGSRDGKNSILGSLLNPPIRLFPHQSNWINTNRASIRGLRGSSGITYTQPVTQYLARRKHCINLSCLDENGGHFELGPRRVLGQELSRGSSFLTIPTALSGPKFSDLCSAHPGREARAFHFQCHDDHPHVPTRSTKMKGRLGPSRLPGHRAAFPASRGESGSCAVSRDRIPVPRPGCDHGALPVRAQAGNVLLPSRSLSTPLSSRWARRRLRLRMEVPELQWRRRKGGPGPEGDRCLPPSPSVSLSWTRASSCLGAAAS